MWFIVGGVLVVLIVIAVVVLRMGASGGGADYGSCGACGKRLKTRQQTQYVRKMLDATRGLQETVYVTEVYCPSCGAIANADLYGEVQSAEQRMMYR